MVMDTLGRASENTILSSIADLVRKNVIGTTVEFETDECGAITKITNISKVKKQAKYLFKESMKQMADLPIFKEMKGAGVDITNYTKYVDTDKLVDGYLDELYMLFGYHGKAYKIGETKDHEM